MPFNVLRNVAPSTRAAVEQRKRPGPTQAKIDPEDTGPFLGPANIPEEREQEFKQGYSYEGGKVDAEQPRMSRGRRDRPGDPGAVFMQEAEQRINAVSRMFNAFSVLESEGLSPEAREQIRQIKEDAAIEVGRLNEQITRWQNGISAFQETTDVGRGMVEDALATGHAGVQANQTRIGAQIAAYTGQGQSAVTQAAANAAAQAIGAMPERLEENVAVPGGEGWDFYMGGVESDGKRAELERQATEGIREMESLVAGSIGRSGDLTAQISKLTAQVANSQLGLLGVTDKKDRLQATQLMETQLRTNIYDLVQNRQDVERNTDRLIAGIERDEAARDAGDIDQFGLGLTGDPGEIYRNTFEEELSDIFDGYGWEFNPLLEDQILVEVGTWLALPVGHPDRAKLSEFAGLMGVNPDDFMAAVNKAMGAAEATRNALTSFNGKRVTPGTTQAAALIFQGALAAGLDPEVANEWANSNVIHALLETQSGGRFGVMRGSGSLAGIGGLPLETYEQLGYSYDEIQGNPTMEMAAFLTYIASIYGDPSAAAVDYMSTKTFGTIPGNYTSVRPPSTSPSEAPRRPVGASEQAGITRQAGGGI